MPDLKIRIEKLEPMRIASVRVISETPERDAWEKLRVWAEPKGLMDDLEKHPVFGFNNPNPAPDRKEYGYEFWIQIDPGTEPEGEIEMKDFAGGLYAVTTCKLFGDPKGNVLEVWMKLLEWVKASKYEWRNTHELEKPHNPLADEKDVVLDLYLPIEA
ncbi:MAG: GyrI-like domain-containing protein [bacterium]